MHRVPGVFVPTRCPVCGLPTGAPCPGCVGRLQPAPVHPPPAGLDLCRSLFLYHGVARRLVTNLKYRNDRAVLSWLADGLAALCQPPPGLVVTWAPTSRRRRHRRGFDQAELLARAVARRWRVPCARLLVRHGDAVQTGSSAAERKLGPSLASVRPTGGAVVIVDDVVTTGSTLSAAAHVLRAAGVGWIAGLTVARTGLPRVSLDNSLKSPPKYAEEPR